MRQRKEGEPPSSEDLDAGTAALDLVKQTKFVPVIFYTARHMEVAHRKAPPLCRSCLKTGTSTSFRMRLGLRCTPASNL